MKKLILGLTIVALVLMGAQAYAAVSQVTGGMGGIGALKTQVLINNTPSDERTLIPLATLPARKCKILGYSVTNINGGSVQNTITLRDASTVAGGLDTTIVGEDEGKADERSLPYTPLPQGGLGIKNGLVVGQGPYTCVTIYFVQVIP